MSGMQRHLGRFEIAFRVAGKQSPGGFERLVVMKVREDIENPPFRLGGMANAVGRNQGQVQAMGKLHCGLISCFLGLVKVPLELDINPTFPKNIL